MTAQSPSPPLTLAADFPPAGEADWRTRVDAVLKGADFEKKLVSRTAEGLRIAPLYPRDATAKPVAGRHAGERWRIAQRLDHPDPEETAKLALEDLEGGADMLSLVFDGAPSARGFGVRAPSLHALDLALADVVLDLIALRLETAPFDGRAAAENLAALAERRGYRPGEMRVDFGLQPIADFAVVGAVPVPFETMYGNLVGIVEGLAAKGFGGPFIRCDSRPFHEAGAGEAQELASLIAQGVAYLRALEARGVAPDAARGMLSFTLAVDADQFLGIAKIRALRLLWARIEAACGLAPQPIAVHAETAWRMLSQRDAYVNLLRNTIATFSAGIGGADSIGVLPFTSVLGLPDAFARRLARNTQHVLLEESNLWRVIDPAAGAGGTEALTGQLCEAAWAQFQEIERDGGIVASLTSGAFQARIAATRTLRDKDIASRKLPLTGVSEYPLLAETPVEVLFPAKAAIGGKGLPSHRLAKPFEKLRDAADAHAARTGSRPKAFLVTFGSVAEHTARLGFAQNFLAAGGIETTTGPLAAVDAATTLACLCGADAAYAAEALTAVQALSGRGIRTILAGRPGELENALTQAGLSGYIHAGGDVISMLQKLHTILGVAGA